MTVSVHSRSTRIPVRDTVTFGARVVLKILKDAGTKEVSRKPQTTCWLMLCEQLRIH